MLARAKHWLMLIAVSVVVFGTSLPAQAQIVPSNCKETVGLTYRMAVCIRATIDAGAAKYFGTMIAFLQSAITAAITLAVVLYGVLLSAGMVEKVGRDTFVLLIKISFVVYLVANSPLIFKTVTSIMDAAAMAVVSFVPASGPVDSTTSSDFAKVNCLQNVPKQLNKPGNPKPAASPWLGVDCMLDSIIGIKIPAKPSDPVPTFDAVFYNKTFDNPDPTKTNRGMSRSLLFFFSSSLQSSIVGMVLGVTGFIFVLGTIFLVIRAFFIYIMGYMGVAFLAIVSPLFIPLLLFTSTRAYFDKWAKLLISFALQPVLMLVFIIFTITAVDLAVFSGNYSIMYRIAGDASREADFDLNTYLTRMRNDNGDAVVCPTPAPGAAPIACTYKPIIHKDMRTLAQVKASNPTASGSAPATDSTDDGGVLSGLKYSKCNKTAIAADTTGTLAKFCGFVYPMYVWVDGIDWKLLATARIVNGTQGAVLPNGYPEVKDAAGVNDPKLQAGQFVLREVLAACFFCVMVVFIMNGLVAIVPAIVGDLLGDAMQSPNLSEALKSKTAGDGKESGMSKKISEQLDSMVGKRT